jgi:ribose 5-phosphate isomerase A
MTSNLPLQDQRRLSAAKHALDFVVPGSVIGSGSTVAKFIEQLASLRDTCPGVVVASKASEVVALKTGLGVLALNEVGAI